MDLRSKLDQILAKLAKLDAIEASLNEFRQKMIKLESEVSKLKDSAGEATKRLDEMDSGMQWLNTKVNDIEGKIKDLERFKGGLAYETIIRGVVQSQRKCEVQRKFKTEKQEQNQTARKRTRAIF